MEHGKLSITETRAGIGSEEDPWTDKSIQPREIVILRFKLVVGPYVIGTPTEVLGGIGL